MDAGNLRTVEHGCCVAWPRLRAIGMLGRMGISDNDCDNIVIVLVPSSTWVNFSAVC